MTSPAYGSLNCAESGKASEFNTAYRIRVLVAEVWDGALERIPSLALPAGGGGIELTI